MRELRTAPADEWGVPLAIIPSENLPYLDTESSTEHHEFFLFRKERFRTFGGQVLRASRILRVEKEVHNHGPKKFHKFYDIMRGPTDEQGKANILLLTLAGYYPKQGIDLWSGTPIIRDMEAGELEILRAQDPENELAYRNLRCNRNLASEFLSKFILKQNVTDADPNALEKFMSTPKVSHMRDEGYEVMHTAIKAITAPTREAYIRAKNEGGLHPLSPKEPETLVWDAINSVGYGGHNQRLLRAFRDSVIARRASLQAA